ncbi:hypothetical protein EVAR_16119_1 [Eumeta japonica]|uniref:Uncharacterized protein n=1 Tax=Eumeta variegata TaxID=151549 RepID=A0A4C1UIL1_EUMVA|nr:hypothetical protein EVAR_16119_1 [Eumeta japonica]
MLRPTWLLYKTGLARPVKYHNSHKIMGMKSQFPLLSFVHGARLPAEEGEIFIGKTTTCTDLLRAASVALKLQKGFGRLSKGTWKRHGPWLRLSLATVEAAWTFLTCCA